MTHDRAERIIASAVARQPWRAVRSGWSHGSVARGVEARQTAARVAGAPGPVEIAGVPTADATPDPPPPPAASQPAAPADGAGEADPARDARPPLGTVDEPRLPRGCHPLVFGVVMATLQFAATIYFMGWCPSGSR